ncbi:MAG: YfhO family protein [Candidatus Omnitrophota bacterium]|nr:YfhO family protein [Candidatus Omnitrophota bacterium]MDZ4243146.1 YfhO family protein [Candidatus Omnitrophota bacterium]
MNRAPFLRKLSVALLFAALLSTAFFDVVFFNRTFKVTTANSQAFPYGAYLQENNKPPFIPVNGTDTPVMEEPVYEFIKRNLWKGILPLWNPHQACGFSLIGMMETAIFFPLTFIMYIFPEYYAWDLLILGRFFFAGLLTYWLMRTLRNGVFPSLTAGVVFMLSGPMVLLQYWTANVDIMAPVLLISLEWLVQRTRRDKTQTEKVPFRPIAYLAITIALTFFAGHPEHVFLVNVFGFAFLVHRLFVFRNEVDWKKCLLSYAAACVLGIGMSAIVLFPFLHTLFFESWHGHPPGTGLLMEEQRPRALTLALPHFFQNVPLTYFWEFSGWWGGYLGTLPLALAVLSLFSKQRRGMNYFLGAVVLILIGKQYGLPVINWLGYLPVFNVCRYAIHSPHLTAFCVALLAGMGVRLLASRRRVFLNGLWFAGTLAAITAIHLTVLKASSTIALGWQAALFAAGLLAAFQLILFLKDRRIIRRQAAALFVFLLVFCELTSYIHRERPARFASFPKIPYMDFLKSSPERVRSYGMFWAFYPNTATAFEVDDLGYFFGLAPKRYVEFVNRLIRKEHFKNDLRPPALRAVPLEGRKPILDLLNIRYIVAPSKDRLSRLLTNFAEIHARETTVYNGEVLIYQRPNAFPRAFVVHKAIFTQDTDKTLTLLEQIGPELRRLAVINHAVSPIIKTLLQDAPVEDGSRASITAYTANEVRLEAVMESAGFLVLSEAYHPGWRAYANGRQIPVYQTNHLLRSVFLAPGRYDIKFVFAPQEFFAGAAVSAACAAAVLLLGFLSRPRRRK